ncbi:MAG: GMC family oxidoreductase [Saprospiraceae bacterium]|nr:GMC family oxidoreductase [Saprospiraceae bacterium]
MKQYDYVIVGSGASGGVLAYMLAASGKEVLVLEAGKFFRKDTFPDNEADGTTQLYWGGGIELSRDAKMAFLRGKCVGGGTVVNQALQDRFDKFVFNDWFDKTGIDFFNLETMNPYYEAVENMLSLHKFTPEEKNGSAEVFTKGCEKLGIKYQYLRRGQSDCATQEGNDCITCLSGCHRDSKQSTLVSFIQRAEKEGLPLTIWDQFQVDKIKHEGKNVRIKGVHKNEMKELICQKLILAAGTFGTNRILLHSGFKKEFPALGTNFFTHPQFMSFGLYDHKVNAHKGAWQTVTVKGNEYREKGFKLENVFAPGSSLALLITETGRELQELILKYPFMGCIEVAIRDETPGEISVDKKGKLIVRKDLGMIDVKRRDEGLKIVGDIFRAANAKRVYNSPYYFGLHQLGGCSIGHNKSNSVVNPSYLLHGYDNIYVADASTFPSAPGINPALSIMTFAYKLAKELT